MAKIKRTLQEQKYWDLRDLLVDLDTVQIPGSKDTVAYVKKMLAESTDRHEKDRLRCDLFVGEVDLKHLLDRKKQIEAEMETLWTEIKQTRQEKEQRRQVKQKAWRDAHVDAVIGRKRSKQSYYKHREEILLAKKIAYHKNKKKEEQNDK